jgi:hypothetical protein
MQQQNIIEIRQNNIEQADKAFRDFMQLTENELNLRAKQNKGLFQKCSATELEVITESILKEVAPQTPFRAEHIQLVSGAKFPDIVAEKYYGIEVKSTEKDHWTSTGSSIVESSRITDVERIYMMFGKLGGEYAEFKCRPYQDVLSEIAVTHSPRYLIYMTLGEGESIFEKMGTTYDQLRTSPDKIEQVRRYYRDKAKSEGKQEMPWWLSENESVKMNLRLWTTQNAQYNEENKRITAKIFILFPEILNSQYGDIAMWLCARYSIVAHNLRDIFSAGGQMTHIDGKQLAFPLPHIVYELLNNAKRIKFYLTNPQVIKEELAEFRPDLLTANDPYAYWLKQIETMINNIPSVKKHNEIVPFAEWFEKEVVPYVTTKK